MYGLNTENNAQSRDLHPDIRSIQVRVTTVRTNYPVLTPRKDIDRAAWSAHDEKWMRD